MYSTNFYTISWFVSPQSVSHSLTPLLTDWLIHLLTLTPLLTDWSITHSVTHSIPFWLTLSLAHSLTPLLNDWLTHLLKLTHSPSDWLTDQSLTHTLTPLLINWLTQSLTHSFPFWLTDSLTPMPEVSYSTVCPVLALILVHDLSPLIKHGGVHDFKMRNILNEQDRFCWEITHTFSWKHVRQRSNLDSKRIFFFFFHFWFTSDFRAVWWQKDSHQQLSALTDFHNRIKKFREGHIFGGGRGWESTYLFVID